MSASDVPVTEALGRDDDVQVVFGAADLLASLRKPGRTDLLTLLQRRDEVGDVLPVGLPRSMVTSALRTVWSRSRVKADGGLSLPS